MTVDIDTEMEAGFDGHCGECTAYSDSLVELPTAGIYLCPACLTEASYVAERW